MTSHTGIDCQNVSVWISLTVQKVENPLYIPHVEKIVHAD